MNQAQKKPSRIEELRAYAHQLCDLQVTAYSPGDGVTRYRFSRQAGDYFEVQAVYTALGFSDAKRWLEAYALGYQQGIVDER